MKRLVWASCGFALAWLGMIRFAVICICLAALGENSVLAQMEIEPGLWEVTTTTRWQRFPTPAGSGVSVPTATQKTEQVCATADMLNHFGAPLPPVRRNCKIDYIVLKSTSMTGKISCSGGNPGIGSISSSWAKSDYVRTTIHLSLSVTATSTRMGPDAPEKSQLSMPMELTNESKLVYKGPECGGTEVLPVPAVP